MKSKKYPLTLEFRWIIVQIIDLTGLFIKRFDIQHDNYFDELFDEIFFQPLHWDFSGK